MNNFVRKGIIILIPYHMNDVKLHGSKSSLEKLIDLIYFHLITRYYINPYNILLHVQFLRNINKFTAGIYSRKAT